MAVRCFAVQFFYKQFNNACRLQSPQVFKRGIESSKTTTRHAAVLPVCASWRFTHTFLSRLTAADLWKSATSLSPAGRKKGRGKSRKVPRDLNRGQVIGYGKKNMLWPGLNSPIIQGREILRQQELPSDDSRERRILELREKTSVKRFAKVHPLERGWSGNKLPGRSLGPPDPVGDEVFDGFDSRVLEFKTVLHMNAQRGRVRNMSAFVAVGNGKGLCGFALAKSTVGSTAAKSAKNRAAKNLRYIELDNNTVIHDFYVEFGAVRLFVKKRPEGYGLVCHPVIRAICQLLGIKDIHVKADGGTRNTQNFTKAFFIGLMKQKSLQQLAEEKGLYLVEKRKDRDYFPTLKATPTKCRTEAEIGPTERIDFVEHLHNGKVEEERKPYQPFYINFPSYHKKMRDYARFRHAPDVRLHLLAKYGAIESFLTIREKEKSKQELKETVEE